MEINQINRLQAMLLAVLTAGLLVLAILNLQQEFHYQQPDDGVWWRETAGGLEAVKVLPHSPGQMAGLQEHDLLTGIKLTPLSSAPARRTNWKKNGLPIEAESASVSSNSVSNSPVSVSAEPNPDGSAGNLRLSPAVPIERVSDLERILSRNGSYLKVYYAITRNGIPMPADRPVELIPVPSDRTLEHSQRVIGLIYLAIGIFVLLRRWTALRATHFFLFCLASFALYTLKYTGRFDQLDWITFWANLAAESLQPALFLHFALSFPEERLRRRGGRRLMLALAYTPGAIILGLWLWAINFWQATGLLKHRLEQAGTAYDAIFYVLAAMLFLRSYAQANTPLLRQQLKWLTRGALLAVIPFTLLYAVPFLLDIETPSLLRQLSGFSLVFLPLTFSWAIVRYRLMDTDLIFKRGVAYTLATGVILIIYFGCLGVITEAVHTTLPESVRKWAEVLALVVFAALFEPLKKRIQTWVDKVFDRHRYDYRRALVDFGRGLSTETNLEALLASIVEQLPRTLQVARVAIFMANESGNLRLAAAHGLPDELDPAKPSRSAMPPHAMALGFLNFDKASGHSHIFLENAQQALHLPTEQQRTAALLDLNYYLPCRVQDGARPRTIAVIGLGRTLGGDFLSSEDVELLESLASYIGIALYNASLYRRLESKIVEFERLKEFNENIVESINVGILALDLEGRVESWNAQMEAMYALSRAEAITQDLRTLFPAAFVEAVESFGNDPGVHHLYKFPLQTRAGEQRTVNIAIAPLLSRDFVPVGRIILVDDISERVTLESQLAQSDKLSSIGLLAAGVAHEINTPLAVISSYSQMLSKQLKGDQRLGPILDKIIQQSFRASEIASGLLNFSRTSTTEFKETQLNQVIRDTITLLEHQFKTAQITLELNLSESLPAINGNAGKLQQVFLNLLLNAKDAMPGGGTLRVTTQANGHVEAIVSDSGNGIAPEHLKRIYDPFFTTKTMPKPGERRGTGLGLSISYGIIQEHAGKIQVESTIGSGTSFHLEFPLLRNSVHA